MTVRLTFGGDHEAEKNKIEVEHHVSAKKNKSEDRYMRGKAWN
jgi:hypothetical protein